MPWVQNKNANQHAHPCIRISTFAQTVITLTDNGYITEPHHEKPCLGGYRTVKPPKMARGLTLKK